MISTMRRGDAPHAEGQIVHNLRRVEGQIRGVQRMVAEGRGCDEIIVQLRAIEASVDRIVQRVLEPYIRECIAAAREEDGDEQVQATLLPLLHDVIHREDRVSGGNGLWKADALH